MCTTPANLFSSEAAEPGKTVVACITTTSAIIRWTTAGASPSRVDFGPTITYGLTASDNESVTDHYVWIHGLTAGTAYHLRTVNGSTHGRDVTFTTAASIAALWPVITISFDDGNESDRSEAWPLMKERNMRGMCNVAPGMQERKQDWLYLQAKGWDIESHSWSHSVAGESEQRQLDELTKSRDWLVANGFGTQEGQVLSFRYPGEKATAYSLEMGRKLGYQVMWGWMEGNWPAGELDLPVKPGFYYCAAWWRKNTDDWLTLIDQAYAKRKYIHLQFHGIAETPGPPYEVNIPKAEFIRILDRCQKYGFTVVPISEVLEAETHTKP